MTELSKRIVLKGAKVIDVALDIESEKDLLIEDGNPAGAVRMVLPANSFDLR